MSTLVHATTIDIAGLGVLILGASGSGKSDLALRLLAEGALLVADDQTSVAIENQAMIARAPSRIGGLLEARGVGIVRGPTKAWTRLALAVELTSNQIERMPEGAAWSLPGQAQPQIPLVALRPFEPSAGAKLRLALVAVPIA